MLWLSINYWPAMRLAFEIILAIPALLFALALIVGARHRRRLKEGRLFTEGNKGNEERKPAASHPPSLPSLPSVEHPVRLSEAEFEAALIAVEQARARGDHAAAEQMLASLHGQAPVTQMQKAE